MQKRSYASAFIYVIISLQIVVGIEAHREHKIHNIVLYPDKHSWCKTLTIKQEISYAGCKSITIDNNVCVGACFSYSIPHTEPSDPGEVIVPYCDSCQPSETNWIHVTLQCDKNDPDTPPQLIKHVQIIQNCSCTSCDKDRYRHHKTGDISDDMMMKQSDVPDLPDLMDALHSRNETPIIDKEHSNRVKELMDHKIITLLKNIQANNSQHDKEQLMDLLRIVQGPNEKVSDKSIADFVDSMNTENIELDIPKLGEILTKFEHSKIYKKHKNFDSLTGIGSIANGNDDPDDQDDADIVPKTTDSTVATAADETGGAAGAAVADDETMMTSVKEFHLPLLVVGEASDGNGSITAQPHHPHHHHHHHHHHLSHTELSMESEKNSDTQIPGTSDESLGKHGHTHHHIHQHHHVGEVIAGGHGHLARGPHGALIIEPDRIQEKLDVNPHELKPNHAGTLLSYHSHHAAEISKDLD